jgi:hypothetical protein
MTWICRNKKHKQNFCYETCMTATSLKIVVIRALKWITGNKLWRCGLNWTCTGPGPMKGFCVSSTEPLVPSTSLYVPTVLTWNLRMLSSCSFVGSVLLFWLTGVTAALAVLAGTWGAGARFTRRPSFSMRRWSLGGGTGFTATPLTPGCEPNNKPACSP